MAHHDLVIIGTGSGNSIPGPEFDHLSIAIVEAGVFGGTCLNVGCIPTKMYVYPAETARAAREAGELGVSFAEPSVDWPRIRDRVFGHIDAIADGGRAYRSGPDTPNITVYGGEGRFTGFKTLQVTYADGRPCDTVTSDRWVLAAGGRPSLPPIQGLELGPMVHTSDTIMRIDKLPRSLIVIGGGFIAAEFAHVFSSFGVKVTQVNRSKLLLRNHDSDIARRFTEVASRTWNVVSGIDFHSAAVDDDGVTVCWKGGSARAEMALVATGRIPNSDRLAPEVTGVAVASNGKVQVDEYQRTNVDGIYALGDLSSPYDLKHVANHEMRVVKHNLAHPDDLITTDHRFVPSAVFTHPQIAAVGSKEEDLVRRGVPYVAVTQEYGSTAYGWAREDTTGFVKLLADPITHQLLGAHVIGPEAATIIQPLIQAMSFGLDGLRMATGQYWIHPAMTEVIENALLQLAAAQSTQI